MGYLSTVRVTTAPPPGYACDLDLMVLKIVTSRREAQHYAPLGRTAVPVHLQQLSADCSIVASLTKVQLLITRGELPSSVNVITSILSLTTLALFEGYSLVEARWGGLVCLLLKNSTLT